MSETAVETKYVLPQALIGRSDLARLVREVETVDNEMEARRVRAQDKATTHHHMPTVSQALNDFLELNKIDITNDQARMGLKEHLRKLKDHAPVLHMTFAVEVDRESMQQLTAWVRQQLHPQALISIGLQPALIAGVYLRTPNHVHDYSLRNSLKGKEKIIMQDLEALERSAAQ